MLWTGRIGWFERTWLQNVTGSSRSVGRAVECYQISTSYTFVGSTDLRQLRSTAKCECEELRFRERPQVFFKWMSVRFNSREQSKALRSQILIGAFQHPFERRYAQHLSSHRGVQHGGGATKLHSGCSPLLRAPVRPFRRSENVSRQYL